MNQNRDIDARTGSFLLIGLLKTQNVKKLDLFDILIWQDRYEASQCHCIYTAEQQNRVCLKNTDIKPIFVTQYPRL
jgi:hypothetical protein